MEHHLVGGWEKDQTIMLTTIYLESANNNWQDGNNI